MSDRLHRSQVLFVLLCLLLFCLPLPAAAVGTPTLPGVAPETTEGLARDLAQGEPAEQRYAARSLRSWIRTWVRQSARTGADPLIRDEARMELETCDNIVAPVCIDELSTPSLTRACAEILGLLETPDARAALEATLATEERRGVRRRLEWALARLAELP